MRSCRNWCGRCARQPPSVLRAPTGAGKTTRVPPALLDAGLAETGRIVMLEPRRLAARAAARGAWPRSAAPSWRRDRLSRSLRSPCRARARASSSSRPASCCACCRTIRFSNRSVIFDEFHERGLESDLALGMVRLVQQTVRPELRLVVMSATLAVAPLAAYLGDCPIVASEGRLYPVEIVYEPKPDSQHWPAAAAARAVRLLERTDGDLLVFLPGMHEIRQTARHLEPLARSATWRCCRCTATCRPRSRTPPCCRRPRRKVVLATNVAETSVTVEGVTGVVDTGLARLLVFDPSVGLDRLELTPISRASAAAAGRPRGPHAAGRLRAALERGRSTRPAGNRPSRRFAASIWPARCCSLLCLGETDVLHFPWLEPPRPETVAQALLLLAPLGSRRGARRVRTGSAAGALAGASAAGAGCWSRASVGRPAASASPWRRHCLSERDPFVRPLEADGRATQPTESDVLDRVEALEAFAARGQVPSELGTLNRGAARFVLQARDHLLRALRQEVDVREPFATVSADEAVLRSLLAAFPDRVARRREAGSRRGVMVGGRGVRLAPSCRVSGELFLCIDVDAAQGETLVRQASAIQREWLPADRVATGRSRLRSGNRESDRPEAHFITRICCSRKRRPRCRLARKRAHPGRGGRGTPGARVAAGELARRPVSDARSLPAAVAAGAEPAGLRRRGCPRAAALAVSRLPFVRRAAARRLAGCRAGA